MVAKKEWKGEEEEKEKEEERKGRGGDQCGGPAWGTSVLELDRRLAARVTATAKTKKDKKRRAKTSLPSLKPLCRFRSTVLLDLYSLIARMGVRNLALQRRSWGGGQKRCPFLHLSIPLFFSLFSLSLSLLSFRPNSPASRAVVAVKLAAAAPTTAGAAPAAAAPSGAAAPGGAVSELIAVLRSVIECATAAAASAAASGAAAASSATGRRVSAEAVCDGVADW